MRRFTLFYLILLLLTCSQALAQGLRNDGKWWRNMSSSESLRYIIGYWDGQAASKPSFWKEVMNASAIASAPEVCRPLMQKMQDDFSNRPDEPDITAGELREGIASLYIDSKNRPILVIHAIGVINRKAAGATEDEIRDLIESFRKLDAE